MSDQEINIAQQLNQLRAEHKASELELSNMRSKLINNEADFIRIIKEKDFIIAEYERLVDRLLNNIQNLSKSFSDFSKPFNP